MRAKGQGSNPNGLEARMYSHEKVGLTGGPNAFAAASVPIRTLRVQVVPCGDVLRAGVKMGVVARRRRACLVPEPV